MPKMQNSLKHYFPHMSIQLLPPNCLKDKKPRTYPWDRLDNLLQTNRLHEPAFSGGFPCDARRLWRYRDIWKKEFSFAKRINDTAQKRLQESLTKWKSRQESEPSNGRSGGPLVVGVHVRRTDYVTYVKRTTGGNVVGQSYYHKAFQYFRQKYGDVAFVIASDDRKWCKRMLEQPVNDVIVSSSGSQGEDMALLTLSSHMIISLGTYGFWAGMLSKGSVTFPLNVGRKREYFLTRYLRQVNSTDLMPIQPYK